jgi:putative heme degradation protein
MTSRDTDRVEELWLIAGSGGGPVCIRRSAVAALVERRAVPAVARISTDDDRPERLRTRARRGLEELDAVGELAALARENEGRC